EPPAAFEEELLETGEIISSYDDRNARRAQLAAELRIRKADPFRKLHGYGTRRRADESLQYRAERAPVLPWRERRGDVGIGQVRLDERRAAVAERAREHAVLVHCRAGDAGDHRARRDLPELADERHELVEAGV